MTKTAYKIVKAFLNGEKLTLNNSHTNGTELFLHGNRIAYKNENNDIVFSLCGWNSITTKDRVNELLSQTRSELKIRSKDWQPFLIKYGRTNDDPDYRIIDSIKINSSDEYNLSEVLQNE